MPHLTFNAGQIALLALLSAILNSRSTRTVTTALNAPKAAESRSTCAAHEAARPAQCRRWKPPHPAVDADLPGESPATATETLRRSELNDLRSAAVGICGNSLIEIRASPGGWGANRCITGAQRYRRGADEYECRECSRMEHGQTAPPIRWK